MSEVSERTEFDQHLLTHLVLCKVADERKRQRAKWGEQNHDPSVWLAILSEEVGEFATAILRAQHSPEQNREVKDMRTEALHVAAVAVQIIEYLDRTAK